MTELEWLEIGYEKKIIEDIKEDDCRTFEQCYKMWFLSKMHKIKPQSLDRIEVTYNKYYRDTDICSKYVHSFNEDYICAFLNTLVLNCKINLKEFKRIYQIINNVLVYAFDFNIGYANLLNWNKVKRSVYSNDIIKEHTQEYVISQSDKNRIYNKVVYENIYPEKRSACLSLVLNFYLGLRIGELSALTFNDFDLELKIVRVSKTQVKYFERDENGSRRNNIKYDVVEDLKTKYSFRVLPLTDECIEIYRLLQEHHNKRGYDSPYICYDGKEVILERSLERTLTRLCILCEVEHINSHRIRKTYATGLHNSNVPTRVISDLLGHSDVSTTEQFYLLGYENIDIFRSKIEQALSIK